MKIVLVNYRYYISGGPERYLFSLKEGLEQAGHEVVPFSVKYTRNEPTAYDSYFVPPLGGDEEIYFHQHRWTPRTILKTVQRSFYDREVEQSLANLCRDAQPDAALVLHYLKKLSPAVLVALKKAGIPIVVRLSDFLMICANALMLRDGKACDLCVTGSRWNGVKHRCVQGSLGASLVHYGATAWHRYRHYVDLVDRFVVPSAFTIEQMVRSGFPKEKFIHLPTFTSPAFFEGSAAVRKQELVFSGHLEPHKGVGVLIDAMAAARKQLENRLPRLRVFGRTEGAYAQEMSKRVTALGLEAHVTFEGFADTEKLAAAYRQALATVMPSTCYENMPNAVIESFACGTPVIASNHGSMAPLVQHGETGLLFKPGSAKELADQVIYLVENEPWSEQAGRAARAEAESLYTRDQHIEHLLGVYSGLRSF